MIILLQKLVVALTALYSLLLAQVNSLPVNPAPVSLGGLGAAGAKIVLINSVSFRQGTNNIGDIVGVFPADWPFTPSEYQSFNIISVNFTKEQAEARLRLSARPKKEIQQNNKTIMAWQDIDGQWKEIEKNPKYEFSFNGMTAVEINNIEAKNNIEIYPENKKTIINETL